jgi:hypothetical protein
MVNPNNLNLGIILIGIAVYLLERSSKAKKRRDKKPDPFFH